MLLKALFSSLLIFALALLNSVSLAEMGNGEEFETDNSDSSSSGEAGHGFVGFSMGFYNNDDNRDGNPFLDEELTVIEPVMIFDYNVTDNLGWWCKFSYEYVSSASIDRLNKFPQ